MKFPWHKHAGSRAEAVFAVVENTEEPEPPKAVEEVYSESRKLKLGTVGDLSVWLTQDMTDTYVHIKNKKNEKEIKFAYFNEFEMLQSMILHGVLQLGTRPNVYITTPPLP